MDDDEAAENDVLIEDVSVTSCLCWVWSNEKFIELVGVIAINSSSRNSAIS